MQKSLISIQPYLFLYLAGLLLILPMRWVAGMVFAAALHELGHLTILKLMGIPIYRICINITGARIETGGMEPVQEIICALAGPAAGMMTAFTARCFPVLFLCAFGQTLFNILPLPFFDGGRALFCMLSIFLPESWVKRLMYIFPLCTILLLLCLAAVYLSPQKLAFLPMVFILLMFAKLTKQKKSCKHPFDNVQ